MKEELKNMICDSFADCLTAEEVALEYAEIYVFLKEQLHFCMNQLTEGDEE